MAVHSHYPIPGAYYSLPPSPHLLPLTAEDLDAPPLPNERTPLLGDPARPLSRGSSNSSQACRPARLDSKDPSSVHVLAISDATSGTCGSVDPSEPANPTPDHPARRPPPESTLNRLQRLYGNGHFSLEKARPVARKAMWNALGALGNSATYVAKGLVNAGAVEWLLTPALKKFIPAYPQLATTASEVIGSGLQDMVSNDGDTPDFSIRRPTPVAQLNKIRMKIIAKIVKPEKFDQVLQPFLRIVLDGGLTLQENVQLAVEDVAAETKEFEAAHPEFKEALAQLRKLALSYKPAEGQEVLDADILGLIETPAIVATLPYLPSDPTDPGYLPPKGIFKSESKLECFDAALPTLLETAARLEIGNPQDMEVFHRRWRNLQLSEPTPFILLGGPGAGEATGAVELARHWCETVDERPMEVEADDLVEMLTGSRPKDAMPRLLPDDPMPMKLLGGFYSRVGSGNPTSPLIIKGFDSRSPDHAILLPLLENSSEISLPYKEVRDVFRFNTKGMAVFLCEDDAAVARSTKLEVPAADKAKDKSDAGDKAKDKDKSKDAKGKAGGDDKGKDKAKDKAKDKGPDGERMKNLGIEKLATVLRATMPHPSEQRRAEKLEAAFATGLREWIGQVVPGNDSAATRMRAAIAETAGSAEHKACIVKKSTEHKIALAESERLARDVIEYLAQQYRSAARVAPTAGSEPGAAGLAIAGAQSQVEAFLTSKAKAEIDQRIGSFIDTYFKRYEKEAESAAELKSEEKKEKPVAGGKGEENKAAAAPLPEWLAQVDRNALREQFPIPLWAQDKQALPKGQTTLDAFLFSPLQTAARRGDVTALEQLAASPDADLKATDILGNGLLHLAVQSGNLDALRTLLAQPALDLEAKNKDGHAALNLAIKARRKDMADLLLERLMASDTA